MRLFLALITWTDRRTHRHSAGDERNRPCPVLRDASGSCVRLEEADAT